MERNTGTLELGFEKETIKPTETIRTVVQKVSREKSFKLNAKDAKILEFCSQMKFASHAAIYNRFFKITLTGQISKSDWYAKERLALLVLHGYLKPNESFTTQTKYYTTTIKGYQAAQMVMPFRELTKPIQGFDLRTFIHDRELMVLRNEMEESKEIESWLSDRRLRMGIAGDFNFSSEFIPDAVVKRPNGDLEAIEVEIAYKSRPRYQAKIQFFKELMRGPVSNKTRIAKVIYVCMRPTVFKALEDECRRYGDMLSVIQRAAPLDLGSDS